MRLLLAIWCGRRSDVGGIDDGCSSQDIDPEGKVALITGGGTSVAEEPSAAQPSDAVPATEATEVEANPEAVLSAPDASDK